MALIIRNRVASFNYTFVDTYIAGISLLGSEVKSIRSSKVSLKEAFCICTAGEIYAINLFIDKYSNASYLNHDPVRKRVLLLKKREILKIHRSLRGTARTLIIPKMFINNRGLIKLELAVAEGKKLYDKRNSIKERDISIDVSRDRA